MSGKGSLLAELTWPEVRDRAAAGAVLVVPVGATEQHGPHLPIGTDTEIAEELCRRLAARRPDVVVAPAVPYGSSGEHAGFAGTLSIGQQVTEALLVELVRSATSTFDRVLLVCAHGGNASPVAAAVARLRAESRDVEVLFASWEGDPHAGRPETSMVLRVRPELVRGERASQGETRPLAQLMPALRSGGVLAVSPTGVLGDPAGAHAAEGEDLFGTNVAAGVRLLERWNGR